MLSLPNTEVVSVPEADEAAALAAPERRPGRRRRRAQRRRCTVAAAPNSSVLPAIWPNDADVDARRGLGRGLSRASDVTVAVIDQASTRTHPELDGQVAPAPRTSSRSERVHRRATPALARPRHARRGPHRARSAATTTASPGIAPLGARVLPLPAIDNCGDGEIADVLEAFRCGGRAPMPIVVGSFATDPLRSGATRRRRRAGQRRRRCVPDTLFVVAAGNRGRRHRRSRQRRLSRAATTRRTSSASA